MTKWPGASGPRLLEHCEHIWDGSPTTQTIDTGIETADLENRESFCSLFLSNEEQHSSLEVEARQTARPSVPLLHSCPSDFPTSTSSFPLLSDLSLFLPVKLMELWLHPLPKHHVTAAEENT